MGPKCELTSCFIIKYLLSRLKGVFSINYLYPRAVTPAGCGPPADTPSMDACSHGVSTLRYPEEKYALLCTAVARAMNSLSFIGRWAGRASFVAVTLLLVSAVATPPARSNVVVSVSSSASRVAGAVQQNVRLALREQSDAARLDAAAALEQLVAASASQVLDPSVLSAATADIASERHAVLGSQLTRASELGPFGIGWSTPARSQQNTLASATRATTSAIATDSAAVAAAVVAWENRPIAPVERLSTANRVSTAAVASGPRQITVFVRTTVDTSGGDNGQSAINAGGEVGVIYPGHGTIVSAHNTNDARALSLRIGDLVTFTGAVQGTYRVTGSIDVPKGSTVDSVDALGTRMMMQTCNFNSNLMRIVGMTPQ